MFFRFANRTIARVVEHIGGAMVMANPQCDPLHANYLASL
jgi:hypothetical protein